MPPVDLTETEIMDLVNIPKQLPDNYKRQLKLRTRSYSDKHEEAQMEIEGPSGSFFRIITRKSMTNPLDFTIIFGYVPPQKSKLLHIRRYNGKSHLHTNDIEGDTFFEYHIHYATERYQEAGWAIEKYAKLTDKYDNYDGALEYMLADCNFIKPENERIQQTLL